MRLKDEMDLPRAANLAGVKVLTKLDRSLVDVVPLPPLSGFQKLRNRITRRHLPRDAWVTTLLCYRLSLPPMLGDLGGPRLRLKSTLWHMFDVAKYSAGYGLWASLRDPSTLVVRQLGEVGIEQTRALPVGEREPYCQVELSPSGAVVVLYETRIVVTYFV
ncbi:hypothetical protein C8R46DRAFT_1220727 [Mycena filopes]|nr:hypothetical protein C8R46DRAFT_1220727 [Mycena filopes]